MVFIELIIFSITYLSIVLYLWIQRRYTLYKSFSDRGIPGPKPDFIYGNLKQLRRIGETSKDAIEQWIDEYGNVFGFYHAYQRYLVINDLDILQTIFISGSNNFLNRPAMAVDAKPMIDSVLMLRNDEWRRVRKYLTPSFNKSKVKSTETTRIIQDCVSKMMTRLCSKNTSEDTTQPFVADIYDLVQRLTLDVIMKTALGMDEDFQDDKNTVLLAVKQFFEMSMNSVVEFALAFPFFKTALTFVNNHMTAGKMTDMIVGHIKKEIREKTKNPLNINNKNSSLLTSLLHDLVQKKISADELIGNVHINILAGYETTANGLAFVTYLLAKHQDIQTRLREAIQDEGVDAEYLEMVWLETLRLIPPVPMFVIREAEKDIIIDGIKILKDDIIMAPVWRIHHRPDIWSEPDEFYPERFSSEERKNHHPASFLPFGMGPRICLGMQLAIWEAKLTLVSLLTKFKIEIASEDPEPLKLKCTTVILNPAKPVNLKFTQI